MFLYWRKRGTYELETLPDDLGQLELGSVERFSWSSALDIIEDLGGRCSHFPEGFHEVWGTWSAWPLLLAKACSLLAVNMMLKSLACGGVGSLDPLESLCREYRGPNMRVRE